MKHQSGVLLMQKLLLWLIATNAAVEAASNHKEPVNHAQRQIDWVRSKGGFVSEKFQIKKLNPDDPESVSGVFAKDSFQAEELILEIPRTCIIDSEMEEPEWICETAQNLIRELRLGNDSKYAPYVNYILDQPYGQLPSMWSDAGKELLLMVTGGSQYQDNQVIPPDGPVGWLDDEWTNVCDGSDDPFEQNAFLTVVQRSWDDLLLPVYDMMSHGNGRWLNTKSNSVRTPQENVYVRASRFIEKGEQLYTSYNKCEDCGGRKDSYGTPELLRDYGFVEGFPQQWCFHEHAVGFTLDYKYEEDGSLSSSQELDLEWLEWSKPLDQEGIEFFEGQIDRLTLLQEERFLKYESVDDEDLPPQHEWQTVKNFVEAYLLALKSLLNSQGCSAEDGTCQVPKASRYDALDELVPDETFNIEGCDRTVSLDFEDYDTVETVQSPYQKISYEMDPKNDDMCFSLETTLQICGSYRPHYHEMVVDYTSRFLGKGEIKRVAWVGGGDSMLLHDILKYKSVEMAVGLELDQTVTRLAFKHFGSQPHWDDDRVQWWYGDASKSLLMLPKTWYGTFDLVLVDLSETVMSMSVTEHLDILGALSLLLKPKGIFVKNESYLQKMSSLFEHTIMLDYYDVPKLCSQCLVLGSNKIDFLKKRLTDHKVETKLSTLKEINDGHYEIINDYLRNPFSEERCKHMEPDALSTSQTSSPGIIMILEAENAKASLQPSEKLSGVLNTALDGVGLDVITASITSDKKGSRVVVMMMQGYVVARTWPEKKYVAFDIHMWSRYAMLDEIKEALLKAVKSNQASSFRIVAGGMLNAIGWQQDQEVRGPKFTQECKVSSQPPSFDSKMDNKNVAAVLEETLNLPTFESVVAVVICGPDTEDCVSRDVVEGNNAIDKVIVVPTCPSIAGGVAYQENASDLMLGCEKDTLLKIKGSLKSEDKGVNLVMFDSSASYEMAQLFHKIASKSRKHVDVFTYDVMVLAPILDPSETWRRVFLDKCLEIFFQKPAFRSEVLFNETSTSSSMEMGTFMTGDVNFLLNLEKVNRAIISRTGMVSDVRNIHGGAPKFQEDFEPSQYFLPGDFDQRKPYAQWQSQQPVGFQTVFQMMLEDPSQSSTLLSTEMVQNTLDEVVKVMELDSKPHHVIDFVGDGCVIAALWEEGNVMIVYDGQAHVDVNLFTYAENTTFATEFAAEFTKAIPSLKVNLRDQMPRGYGRVVNFAKDLGEPRKDPSWAKSVIQK